MKKPIILSTPSVSVRLDTECIICHGKGRREKGDKTSGYLKDDRCGRCKGVGFELTNDGWSILELLRRYKNTWVKTLEC